MRLSTTSAHVDTMCRTKRVGPAWVQKSSQSGGDSRDLTPFLVPEAGRLAGVKGLEFWCATTLS